MTEQRDLAQIGDWVFQTCLLFGSQRSTAYLVAGYFLRGLERNVDWEPPRRRGRQSRQSKAAGDESAGIGVQSVQS